MNNPTEIYSVVGFNIHVVGMISERNMKTEIEMHHQSNQINRACWPYVVTLAQTHFMIILFGRMKVYHMLLL